MILESSDMTFDQWMNRPLKRVWVFTFKKALAIYDEALSLRFRCLPAYRDDKAKIQRKEIARRLRLIRRTQIKIALPHYNDQTGNYTQ